MVAARMMAARPSTLPFTHPPLSERASRKMILRTSSQHTSIPQCFTPTSRFNDRTTTKTRAARPSANRVKRRWLDASSTKGILGTGEPVLR